MAPGAAPTAPGRRLYTAPTVESLFALAVNAIRTGKVQIVDGEPHEGDFFRALYQDTPAGALPHDLPAVPQMIRPRRREGKQVKPF